MFILIGKDSNMYAKLLNMQYNINACI